MSGHSKWANIKHKKEKSDSKRGKLFTKLGREIAVAVKSGGPDPEANSKLQDIITKAKAANMPNDNITRSIKKAAGDGDTNNYEEITYEGYGPSGVAVIVEALTDNRNRTAGDVRHYFEKSGGNLGTTNCVSFLFTQKGVIIIARESEDDDDKIMMDALDSGAEDFNAEDEYYEVSTSVQDFSIVRNSLEKKGYSFESAEISMVPNTWTVLTDEEQIKQMEKLIDMLEDLDDIQNVYTNWEQPE